jgi:hypothetical protein
MFKTFFINVKLLDKLQKNVNFGSDFQLLLMLDGFLEQLTECDYFTVIVFG